MKKRSEWMTREKKRACRRENDKGIACFIKIIKHFFKSLTEWIGEMNDPRHPSYVQYNQTDLVYVGLLKNVCSVESMRQMTDMFNEDSCIRTISFLSGNWDMTEMPHGDTLNFYLKKLSPECLSEPRRKMVKELLKSRRFHKFRLLGKYWRVIIDGTGLFYFKERHCENCLKEVHRDADGKKTCRYYHKVLEAKLVLMDGLVISLGTEFIENEREDVEKQDCELNSAKRLMERLKREYPRLCICIQADALYETEPFMELCRQNGWEYIFTHKDTRQKVAGENYALLDEEKTTVYRIGRENGTGRFYNEVGVLAGKREVMNLFEYSYVDAAGEVHLHQWNTSLTVTVRNLGDLVDAGRGRWQIENEGFNLQKNTLYKVEHLNSRNPNAMKNHYLLTQIADIIMQLYLHWNLMSRKMGQGIKNTSARLLESFRRQSLTEEDVSYIMRRTSMYLE